MSLCGNAARRQPSHYRLRKWYPRRGAGKAPVAERLDNCCIVGNETCDGFRAKADCDGISLLSRGAEVEIDQMEK